MAYNEFAYFYDEFNGEADYEALYAHIKKELEAHGIQDGILADLGCGTGELTLMLTQAGYDMIGIDQSEEMLCVVRDKAEQLGLSGGLLLLRQDLLKLDNAQHLLCNNVLHDEMNRLDCRQKFNCINLPNCCKRQFIPEHLLHYLFVEKHHSGEFLRVILFHETDVFFILFYRYGIDEKSLTSASDLDFRYHLPL